MRYILLLALFSLILSSCKEKCYSCQMISHCVDCKATDRNTGSIRNSRIFCGEEREANQFERDFQNSWSSQANVECSRFEEETDLREECGRPDDVEDDIFTLELAGYKCTEK